MLSNDDVDVVLIVVNVRHHGHDRGDVAALRARWRHEARHKGITREVARSTDAVHHLGARDVSGVDVAVNVGLNHSVTCNHAEASDNFWVVGDFLRTQNNLFGVLSSIFVDPVCVFRRQRKCGCRRHRHGALIHQVDHPVLDNLRVGRDVVIRPFQQPRENSVRNVPHTGLHRKQFLGQTPSLDLAVEEIKQVVGNLLGIVVDRLERGVAVRSVGFDDCDDLVDVDINVGGPDPVTGVGNRNGLTVRQLTIAPDVMHAFEVFGLPGVDLNNYFLGITQIVCRVTDGRRGDNCPIFLNAHCLNDGHIGRPEEPLVQEHSRV